MSNWNSVCVSEDILDRCPCLVDSSYKVEARELLALSPNPSSDWDLHKIMAVYRLCFHFRQMETALPDNPAVEFSQLLKNVTSYLEKAIETIPPFTFASSLGESSTVEQVTADHYGNLFSSFDDEKYYDEPKDLLCQRLKRNGFDLRWFDGKSALDAGC